MTERMVILALSGVLGLAPIAPRAQSSGDEWTNEGPGASPAPQEPSAPSGEAEAPAQPPPAPPGTTPAPPAQAEATASLPPGQWVYTQQYGWIWMPYSDAYTYVPAGGYGAPYAYVYYPAYAAWTWVAAPWIWGIGPWPFFGAVGPTYFAWYGYGWWRYPSYWHYYAPAYAGGYRPVPGRPGYYGARPVPGRPGYPGARPAPGRHGYYGGRPAPGHHGYRGGPGPGYRGGYAMPAPHGGSRGGRPAPSAWPSSGGGRGGGSVAPRGFAGRSGGSAGPRFGGGGARGGGSGGRGHR